jgi:mRNA interferase MazF
MTDSGKEPGVVPRRGSLWWVDFSPTRGREQRGDRPAFILSDDRFNEGPAGLVVSIPLTTTARPNIPTHVEVTPDQSDLDRRSFVMCEQVRATAKSRFRDRIGRVYNREVIRGIEDRVRMLLGL